MSTEAPRECGAAKRCCWTTASAKTKEIGVPTIRDCIDRIDAVVQQHHADKSGFFYEIPDVVSIFVKIVDHLVTKKNVTIVDAKWLSSEMVDTIVSTMQTALPREHGYFVGRYSGDMVIDESLEVVILFGVVSGTA
jgi:predicted DNA binding protein